MTVSAKLDVGTGAGGAAASSVEGEFFLTRVFDAPRDLVFQAYTEPERLKLWFGPKGCTMSSCTLDLRPEGAFHYCMRTPGGEMWGRWVFREITAPEQLVYVVSFSDEHCGTSRHPFAPDWPLEVLATLTLDEQEGGRTSLTIRSIPLNATEAERAAFEVGHESMRKGFAGSLDQLADYLATAA